ncbi:MAG: ABC transporter ATP-binding protein [Proteobacteria bacterium]|jgi:spermidine/putrescine transport system ATP-binding protein|nr:ABC transporter ATP-binding protein [Pseudomonadota bacterium]
MLKIQSLCKSFSEQNSVQDVNLEVRDGEFFSLLGPSGCGKTTLLRMIAGLETPTSGKILLDGRDLTDLPTQERPFNMVFQSYALFPHLSVFENVAFGLRLKKLINKEVQERVVESLALVNLSHLKDRLPETLSGGQCQRVAIARALVNRPRVILLDEPLSALDQKLREHMQVELKALQQSLGLTFVYVTHDQEEALVLSDRIGVMNLGRLEQVSAPQELYDEPRSLFAAKFVGPMTEFAGEVLQVEGSMASFRFQDQVFKVRARQQENLNHSSAAGTMAMVRPDRIKISREVSGAGEANLIPGRVTQTIFRGTQSEVLIEVSDGQMVKALISRQQGSFPIGEYVWVTFDPDDTFLFLGHPK